MHRYDTKRRTLALGIAGLAGFVDATGFLAANSYFVSFMSGNTTRLGVDLATQGIQALIPALLIVGFVIGVTLGALIADRFEARRKSAVIGFSSLLLLAAAIVYSSGSQNGYIASSVLAMGALNNTFRRDKEVAIGVTYMTGALVRFGQGIASLLAGERRPGWALNLLLWASLLLGAVVGAVMAIQLQHLSAWVAAGIALCLLVAATLIERIDSSAPSQSI
mgnify:CR=1 FL=1